MANSVADSGRVERTLQTNTEDLNDPVQHLPATRESAFRIGIEWTSILLDKKTRIAATYLGTWIVLLVLFIYGPILIVQMSDPSTAVKVEGINYFADTLLFAGAILALASATPRTN